MSGYVRVSAAEWAPHEKVLRSATTTWRDLEPRAKQQGALGLVKRALIERSGRMDHSTAVGTLFLDEDLARLLFIPYQAHPLLENSTFFLRGWRIASKYRQHMAADGVTADSFLSFITELAEHTRELIGYRTANRRYIAGAIESFLVNPEAPLEWHTAVTGEEPLWDRSEFLAPFQAASPAMLDIKRLKSNAPATAAVNSVFNGGN